MNFSKKTYGGTRPVFAVPPVPVSGGFELDLTKHSIAVGKVIPAGTLASVNENTRKLAVLKSAKVKAINAQDATKVTLDVSDFLTNLFESGDVVHYIPVDGQTPAVTISIVAVNDNDIVLSEAIPSLAVGDLITQKVVAEGAASLVATFNAVVLDDTEVKNGVTGIDATKDTILFENRILPIPSSLVTGGEFLAVNPQIRFSKQL